MNIKGVVMRILIIFAFQYDDGVSYGVAVERSHKIMVAPDTNQGDDYGR